MEFNTFGFFLFVALTVTAVAASRSLTWRLRICVVASLAFYAFWSPLYATLLLASGATNYLLGRWIAQSDSAWPLRLGIAFNLGLIGFFKYADFLIGNARLLCCADLEPLRVVLPLGISFYTFEQIAYLVSIGRDKAAGCGRDALSIRPTGYALFVSFFPHLIAGPIIQPKAFFAQLSRHSALSVDAASLARGLSLFIAGLAKKVLIADLLAPSVQTVFHVAEATGSVGFFDAWAGAVFYAFQIYFDFSGYSDMALGLALIFRIELPQNFNSPYRAASIIDFWRRWHMSLSAFLRDYLYIPLGGNRGGRARQYVNILAVMALGGLWHGAGWTFVVWGTAHGVLIVLNHLWRDRFGTRRTRWPFQSARELGARVATLLAVVVLWVAFRSVDLGAMVAVYKGMLGMSGFVPLRTAASLGLPPWQFLLTQDQPIFGTATLGLMAAVAAALSTVCQVVPNTGQLFLVPRSAASSAERRLRWQPNLRWLGLSLGAGLLCAALIFSGSRSEFIYFQF